VDERSRYFRRLRKLKGSARRWSVVGGGLTAATAVLLPYSGVGLPDVFWAAGAGTSVVLAWWRWRDHRELAALPPPPELPPALPGARIAAAVERFPAGRQVLGEVRRQRDRYALRGSAVARSWDRLDRAAVTLTGLAPRLTGHGESALLEAATAEQWLRDLGQRAASVERALPMTPAGNRATLEQSHKALTEQFSEGVTAYESLVSAAASYVAEEGHTVTGDPHPAFSALIDATDRLRGVAEGLSELRRPPTPA
jgi:hypothetical protein